MGSHQTLPKWEIKIKVNGIKKYNSNTKLYSVYQLGVEIYFRVSQYFTNKTILANFNAWLINQGQVL